MIGRTWGIAAAALMGLAATACQKDYQFTDLRTPSPAVAAAPKSEAKSPPRSVEAPVAAPKEAVTPAPVIVQQIVLMKPNPFDGMSTEQVLRAKYKRALLTCQLRLQQGRKLDDFAAPQDVISWDILEDANPDKTFHMRGRVARHELDFDVKVESMKIAGFIHYADPRGAVYQMESSLVVRLQYRSTERIEYDHEIKSTATNSGSEDMHERILNSLVSNEATMEGSPIPFLTDLRCLLHTEINPDYKDQFQVKASDASDDAP